MQTFARFQKLKNGTLKKHEKPQDFYKPIYIGNFAQ